MERPSTDNELNSTRDEEDEDLLSLIHSYPNNKNEVVEVSPKGRFYRFNDLLGSGAYKTVYRGLDNDQGCEVAWNSISLKNLPAEDRAHIAEEVKLNRRLNHPNIVHFISAWTNPNKEELVFISELVTGGSLRQYLKKIKFPRLKVVKSWCRGTLLGLQYLHSQKPFPIIHRDLKCDNIFIMSNTGDVKIGDFGLSTIMRSKLQTSVLGTPEYMAPEVYEGSYDTKVDIFSFGMCVLEMCTLAAPYKECQTPAAVYRRVMSRILPESLKTIQDEDVKNFISTCLEVADKRPSVDVLLNHPFLVIDEKDPKEYQAVALSKQIEEEAPQSPVVVSPNVTKIEEEETLIESSLIIKDARGALRQVTFHFDMNSDTPENVAEEMVEDLNLDPALVIPIANEIELLVFANSSSKQHFVDNSPKEKNIAGSDKKEDNCKCVNNRAPIVSNRKMSITVTDENSQDSQVFEEKQAEFTLEDLLFSAYTSDIAISSSSSSELPEISEEILYPFTGIIKRGSSDNKESVILLQETLAAVLKTRVKADGFYGKKCEMLVKKFQDRLGLVPDGIVTEDVWNKLMIEYSRICEED